MDLIVDIQGFKQPIDEFVLKEIAIMALKSDKAAEPTTFLFAPPCAWTELPVKYRVMNSWLVRNFHGISWDSGDLPYRNAKKIIAAILNPARTVYVKGLEKKRWLTSFMDESSASSIVDLETLECPSLRKLPTILPVSGCPHHSNISKFNCATENVKSLKNWLNVYHALCERNVFWINNTQVTRKWFFYSFILPWENPLQIEYSILIQIITIFNVNKKYISYR